MSQPDLSKKSKFYNFSDKSLSHNTRRKLDVSNFVKKSPSLQRLSTTPTTTLSNNNQDINASFLNFPWIKKDTGKKSSIVIRKPLSSPDLGSESQITSLKYVNAELDVDGKESDESKSKTMPANIITQGPVRKRWSFTPLTTISERRLYSHSTSSSSTTVRNSRPATPCERTRSPTNYSVASVASEASTTCSGENNVNGQRSSLESKGKPTVFICNEEIEALEVINEPGNNEFENLEDEIKVEEDGVFEIVDFNNNSRYDIDVVDTNETPRINKRLSGLLNRIPSLKKSSSSGIDEAKKTPRNLFLDSLRLNSTRSTGDLKRKSKSILRMRSSSANMRSTVEFDQSTDSDEPRWNLLKNIVKKLKRQSTLFNVRSPSDSVKTEDLIIESNSPVDAECLEAIPFDNPILNTDKDALVAPLCPSEGSGRNSPSTSVNRELPRESDATEPGVSSQTEPEPFLSRSAKLLGSLNASSVFNNVRASLDIGSSSVNLFRAASLDIKRSSTINSRSSNSRNLGSRSASSPAISSSINRSKNLNIASELNSRNEFPQPEHISRESAEENSGVQITKSDSKRSSSKFSFLRVSTDSKRSRTVSLSSARRLPSSHSIKSTDTVETDVQGIFNNSEISISKANEPIDIKESETSQTSPILAHKSVVRVLRRARILITGRSTKMSHRLSSSTFSTNSQVSLSSAASKRSRNSSKHHSNSSIATSRSSMRMELRSLLNAEFALKASSEEIKGETKKKLEVGTESIIEAVDDQSTVEPQIANEPQEASLPADPVDVEMKIHSNDSTFESLYPENDDTLETIKLEDLQPRLDDEILELSTVEPETHNETIIDVEESQQQSEENTQEDIYAFPPRLQYATDARCLSVYSDLEEVDGKQEMEMMNVLRKFSEPNIFKSTLFEQQQETMFETNNVLMQHLNSNSDTDTELESPMLIDESSDDSLSKAKAAMAFDILPPLVLPRTSRPISPEDRQTPHIPAHQHPYAVAGFMFPAPRVELTPREDSSLPEVYYTTDGIETPRSANVEENFEVLKMPDSNSMFPKEKYIKPSNLLLKRAEMLNNQFKLDMKSSNGRRRWSSQSRDSKLNDIVEEEEEELTLKSVRSRNLRETSEKPAHSHLSHQMNCSSSSAELEIVRSEKPIPEVHEQPVSIPSIEITPPGVDIANSNRHSWDPLVVVHGNWGDSENAGDHSLPPLPVEAKQSSDPVHAKVFTETLAQGSKKDISLIPVPVKDKRSAEKLVQTRNNEGSAPMHPEHNEKKRRNRQRKGKATANSTTTTSGASFEINLDIPEQRETPNKFAHARKQQSDEFVRRHISERKTREQSKIPVPSNLGRQVNQFPKSHGEVETERNQHFNASLSQPHQQKQLRRVASEVNRGYEPKTHTNVPRERPPRNSNNTSTSKNRKVNNKSSNSKLPTGQQTSSEEITVVSDLPIKPLDPSAVAAFNYFESDKSGGEIKPRWQPRIYSKGSPFGGDENWRYDADYSQMHQQHQGYMYPHQQPVYQPLPYAMYAMPPGKLPSHIPQQYGYYQVGDGQFDENVRGKRVGNGQYGRGN